MVQFLLFERQICSIRFLSCDNHRDSVITVQSFEAEAVHGNYEKES